MTREEYARLVEESVEEAREDPRRFARSVAALGANGYLFLAASLITLAGVTFLLGWVVIGWFRAGAPVVASMLYFVAAGFVVLVTLMLTIIRVVWVRTVPPEGVSVTRSGARELVEQVDRVRRELGAPRVHRLLLTGEVNASIVQAPRLGVFGWHRNYLTLGAPLMHALSPAEMQAILAHEFAHLSGAHGKAGTWVYRVRGAWVALEVSLRQNHPRLLKLAEWFLPRFLARSLALMRIYEVEADRVAAEWAGPAVTARALLRTDLSSRYLRRHYWPEIGKRAREDDAPPTDVVSAACRIVADGETQRSTDLLGEALNEAPDLHVPHLPLARRLEPLGYASEADVRALLDVEPDRANAWEALVGSPELLDELDERWAGDVEEAWSGERDRVRELEARLAELDAEAADGSLPRPQVIERAWLTAAVGDLEEAVERLRPVLAEDPSHAKGNLVMGQLLLELGDEAGLRHLETAMDSDRLLTYEACVAAREHLLREGQWEEANAYEQRALEHAEAVQAFAVERSPDAVTPDDVLHSPALGEDELQALLKYMRPREQIAAAYLVRKEVSHFPERPLYILGVEVDWRETMRPMHQAAPKLLQSLYGALLTPDDTLIFLLNTPRNDWLEQRLLEVPGSLIYRRDSGGGQSVPNTEPTSTDGDQRRF